MLKRLLIGIALIGVSVTAIAAEGSPADGGKIVIYRDRTVMGAAVGCPVRYRQRELVELGRGKFAEWDVAPGRYILTNKTASIEVTVAPGETRYVRCQVKAGFLSGRADLQIVDAETFEPVRADFERKPIDVN